MVQHRYILWCKTVPVKDKLTAFVLCLLVAGISLASDNGLCKPEKSEVLCSASGDRWIKRREQFIFINGTGCKVRQTISEEIIVCPRALASGSNEPCRRGRQLVEMIRFVPKKCVCVPVKYSQEISCPCRSSRLSDEDCRSNNGVRVITYERRAGDECERRHVRVNNETCTQGHLRFAIEEHHNDSISGHLMRSRRSAGSDIEACGKNQIFVVNRNPCPDTCERVLFGKPNVCHRAQAGPGCECRQGYVLDGILCVPPSQCGCLNAICVDRAPAEKCHQWRAEGRCEKDQVAMSKVCRATCHNCQQPCEDMISTVQCEQLKQEGKCQDDFYRTVCRLTCSPQECRCPPCRIDKGECNPETRNVEIRQTCFRLQRDGQCKPLITKQFKPCGECPMGLVREPGPCNYCQRQRQVVLRTFFREDGGLFRCTVVKHVKVEPCACQPVNLIKSTCVKDKLLVRKLLTRKQTSCSQCSLRKIQLPNRLIVCKKTELRSGNCYRKGPNQPLIRKIVAIHEVARQCKCQPMVQVREEICNCPPNAREGPTCFAHRNQLAFKTTAYVVQGKQCVPRIGHEWIPRPACPPSDKADEHHGKFECNPETCERTWHKTTWHWEECKCKPITLTEPSGKCCCPKPRRVLSPCQKGMQKEQLITYELVEGQCIRHVQNRLIPCACPLPQHSYKCRTDTNERMIKTVLYKRLPDKNCGRIESVFVLPTTCKEEGIRRITECVGKPGESRPTRNLLITTPKVDNCVCKEPEAKVVDEACGCPEAQEPPVKLIHKCPETCHQQHGDHCGTECNEVFIWQRFVYDKDSDGNAPRCKTEVIRKIVKPCCCPRNRRITRSCDPTGQYEMFKVTENRLRHDKCVPILRVIRRPVHCTSGFQQRVWGPVEADGTRQMKLLFNHVKRCHCATQAVQRACSQQCPKPIQTTTCDPGSRELVHTVENFIPIGCRCDKRVFKRRTSVLCPEHSELISTHCSPETNIETSKYRRHFQHNCECREEEITKHRPCGCSEPMLSEPVCDAKNNQIHRIQTVFDVVENKCIPRKLAVHKPVDCRPFELEEAKRNHGAPRVELHCDAKSGRGRLVAEVWQPVNCRCVKRPQVIREGVCQCPPPQKVMHCDGTRNLWIRKTVTFHLDKKTLKCRRHIREEAQPTYCQSARIRWGPCNPRTGRRKLHLIYHRRDHCHCIREMRVMEKPCVCESKQVKKQRQCDSLRGILHTVFLTQHWSDKLHQCVPARIIRSTTIKCLPLARLFRAPCSQGKMLEKIVESYRDVNECQCRKRIRTEVRDCRCPTKMLIDGKCDGHQTHWDELMVEQQWSEEKRACVVERIKRARHHCRCDEPKVFKECAKGVMHETKIISSLNVRTGSCDRSVLQRQYKPACESLMGMESQAQHDQLFVRNRQTQCDPNTCTRQLETYTRRYDPGRCSCDWSLVKTRRCTCCGCPKPKVQASCQNNRELVGQVIYYTTHQQRCGHQCIEKTHAIHSEVDCHEYPPPPNGHWNDCDRKTCVQHFIAYTYEVQMCWCALTKKVLATRACCCPPNVRKEQKCTHGLPELVTYHTVLRDGRCVEVAKPEPLPLVCPDKKEIRHGECRPDSCRQPIFELGWRVDPETCKCQTYQVLQGERECCCLEKSNVRAVCVGSCSVVVQEIFKYDQQNERCIKENHIQRVCPECPKPHVIREECDRENTCLQTIKHVDFVLEDCHCKRLERAEKVSCCCPKSTVLGTRCLEENGQVETKTLFYELVNGQCARRVKLDRMPVLCPPPGAAKLTPSCDPQTCLEPVLEQRWLRVGCRCVEQKPQQYRTCCCSNRISRTKRICNPDGSSLLMTQSWRLHNGHCVPQVITKRLDVPVCHPQRVTALGTCDTVTRRQVALVERFAVKQCRCQAIFREKIERICACPAPVEHAEPCQHATCLQRIVRIPWALDEQKGQCVRLPLQVQMRPCCCLREKEPPVEGTRCNPLTGEVELTRRSFVFNLVKRVCEVQEDKRYNKLDCPSHGRILRGQCNPLNGIAIDQVEMWEARLSECQCRRLRKTIKRICSCSHLDHVLPPMCLADEGVLIKKHVVHHLRQNGCQPEEKILKETIVCAEGEHPQFQCNPTTCDSVRTVSWVERVGCKCVPRVREERGKCCCPEPTEQQECTNGGRLLVLHKLSFILDKTRQTCVPQKDKVQKEIECHETGPHVLKEYCDKETCHPVALLRQVVLRNCQCGNLVLRKRNKNTLCCCPPPRFKTNCYPQYGVISRVMYRYELFKGHCISRKFVDQDKIVCPKERINRGVCNRATGMRPLLRRYYELVGCKCHLRIRKDTEPCSCPLPETVKLPCDPAKPIRKVVRVSFDLEEDTINRKMRCAKRIQHIRNEPCGCESTKIEKHCGRGELVVIRKEHHLTVKGDDPTCVQRTYVKRVPVICAGELIKIYRSQCEGFQRKVIHVREFVDANTCECRNQARVTFEACNCHLKNRVHQDCKNGVLLVSKELYTSKPFVDHCIITTTRGVHPVVCKGRHEIVQTSGCTIQKDNGLFHSEEVRWQQVENCQCITRRKQTLRLCGCPEPQLTKRCLDTVSMAVYKTTFIRIADECVPSQEVLTSEVRCTDPAKIVERSTCETAGVDPSTNSLPGCFETFQVAVRQVEDCKCVEKLLSVRRRCCTPEPVVTRQCDMTRGAWVTTLKKFTLVPGKNLFELGSVVIRDHVLNVVREQQDQRVVCPEPKVHENCDAQTGLWTRTVTRFEMANCHCIPMRQVERGRCQCPPPRITETECKNNFRLRISDSYELINGKCVQRHDSKRIRCGCPKPVRRVYCDGEGQWVKCYTQFLLNPAASTCRLVKHCVRWYQDCPKDTTRVSVACSAQTEFKHTLQRVRFVNNPKTCHCDPQILDQWTEMCQCDHLKRKWLRCKLGLIEIKQLTHHLENGDCVPKMVKHVKLPVCPKPHVHIRACDRNPNSPMKGWILKAVDTYHVRNCQCVRKRRLIKKPCDCNLIHPPRHARRCEEPAILHIKAIFWTQTEEKCIPGFAIYTKHIKCPTERKLRLSPCVEGMDGIGRRLVEQIEQHVEHCECVWKVVVTQHRICKCPPPKHSKECVDGGKAILRTLIAYTLKDDMCAPIQRQIKENPCERQELPPVPPDQTGRCNPLTCSTERIHYQRVSVNCNCITQRVVIKEACCCPRPSKPVLRCHTARNVMLHQQAFYQFKPAMGEQRAHCLPVMHVKSIAINCGPKLQRILVKKCDGEFHRVMIIRTVVENCLCKQRPTKELRIRCGCPRVIRRLPGPCINQWANDRWIGFQAVVVKRSNLLKVNRVKCKPVIFEQKQRRCACPEPTEAVECEGGKLRVKYRTIYKLNEELNNCEKHVFRKEDNPVCPPTKVVQSQCGPESNYEQTEITRAYAVENCECTPRLTKVKWICDCSARFPVQRLVHCLPLGTQRLVEIRRWIQTGRECKPLVEKRTEPVECPKQLHVIKGECDREIPNRRKLIWLQQRPVNCRCVWHRLIHPNPSVHRIKSSVACRCRPKITVRQCRPPLYGQLAQMRMVTVNFQLRDGECRPESRVDLHPVDCKNGVQLMNGECDPMTNTRIVKRIISHLEMNECRCVTREFERRCHCSCPPTKLYLHCQRQQGLVRHIKIAHFLAEDKCLCKAKRAIRTSKVVCPIKKRLIQRGPCQHIPGKSMDSSDKYRQVVWEVSHRDGCQCVTKRVVNSEPCFCTPQPIVEKRCLDDQLLETTHSERRLSEVDHKCIRVVVNKIAKPVDLGKPEVIVRCNPQTGIEEVTELSPYAVNCKRNVRVKKSHRRCKCKVQPQLIHRDQCDSTCQQRLVWRREVQGEDGSCRLQHRLERRACCCPQTQQLEPRCNAAKRLLEVGFRTFTLHAGVCVPQDQFMNKAIVCEPNEQVTQHPQPNGFVRVERHFNELDGCNCVRKKEVRLNKWNCPEPITKQRCTNPEPGLYTIETVSTRWHVPKESPVCSRLDTVVDSNPVDCSAKQLVRADACQLEPQRHATVRVDHLFTSVNDGCRCVRNPPTLKVHVCQCMRPEDHVMCDRERGLLEHVHIKYELSGDGTRCIPHKTKRIWRPSCSPAAPRHVRTTPCDPSTGLMYQIFEEVGQKDCRCVNLEKRVPIRCHCAKPIQESRCLSPQIREIRTTTFHLTPEGTCGKTVLTHKEEVRCQLLPQLLQSSPTYRVQRSQDKPNLIQHVHACHSAGRCLYKVREFLVAPDQSCACRWKFRELVRACCCPTDPQPQPLSSRCDASKGLIVFRKVDWNKHNGVCRPNMHERVKQIVCEHEETMKPLGPCQDGRQKKLVKRWIRVGCKCVLHQQVVVKPCVCHTVSTAEVVFMIDGAAAGRQTQYQERVQQLLFKTIEQFLLSHETKSQSNSFRFAVMTYADRPEIVFNLQNYEDPNRILEQVQELTLRGERANLALALHTMLREVLPLKRPDVPVLLYIVTDGRDQDEDTVRLIGQVHRAQIQVTVAAMGAEPYGMNYLGALVTPPKAVHLLRISNTDNVNQYLTRISETLCSRACPANYVKSSDCSRETGCIGRSYIHTYQFDGHKGQCVGATRVQTRRCCCIQQAPPPVRQCEQNRLVQIISNWQLTKDGTCSKFVIKRDATPLLIQQCSPPVDVRVGQCNAEGYAVELTVRRFLDNCECKESKSRRIVRCRCSPVHETKRCLTDEIQIREITSQELINGECHSRKLVKKTKLKCPPPLVYRSDCDSMTCQRRVTIVEHVPEQCICKRFARVTHETCCCKGQKAIRYEGCRYNALKTFVEESIEPKLTDGACVKRTRHRFEPVACPRNPTTVRHQCRHVSTMESGLRQKIAADPALIFRQVEQFWWQMDSCECRQMRRAHFEACGCDQSAVPAESQFVHRCNQQNGVVITYKQTLKLEVDGTRQSSDQTLMIPDLSHAKCRPEHTIVSARKIVCPEPKVFHTACETAADGREYRAVQVHRWNRQGCACHNLPPELVERQLCSCRPEHVSKQCVTSRPGGPENRMIVKHIREEIVVTQDPSGKRVRLCKLAPIEEKVHLISCPRSQIKYSGCVNGLVHITLRLNLVTECQCHMRIRRLVTKCSSLPGAVNPAMLHGPVSSNNNVAVKSQATQSPIKGHAQLVLPVYQIADCIDLLPVKQCSTLEHPPHQVCEKPGQIRDLLCRRTCKQCTTCPLDQTKFSVVLGRLKDACIVSDKRYERMFFIRALVKRGDLAACKLACAKTPECSSIDYYVPRNDEADQPKCILNRVDPPTLMKRLDPGTVRIGSTEQDLERWNARKCILFRKTCAAECPKPQTIELSTCECHQFRPNYQVDPTEDQLKPVTHCAKQVRVRYFTQTSYGRCVAKEWIGMTPCVVGTTTVLDGPQVNCLDTKPPLWCQSVITPNPTVCRDISMKKMCSKSCGLCHCRGNHVIRGRCDRTGHNLEIKIVYREHPIHKLCITELMKRRTVCEYCPVGKFSVVHECDEKSGTRHITHVRARLTHDQPPAANGEHCVFDVDHEKASCSNCLASQSDRQSITACIPVLHGSDQAKIKLITEYMVNIHGCCRVRRAERSFYCDGCPPIEVETSPCFNGQRLRHIIFYTRPTVIHAKHPSDCIRRVITRKEHCIPVPHSHPSNCFDQLSTVDCHSLLSTGQCDENSKVARKLCAKTCGFCG